jgi:hypothetical protein
MKVITSKTDNSIIAITISTQEDVQHNNLITPEVVYCGLDRLEIYDVETIPTGVKPNEYCYTADKGFTVNANYIDPNAQDKTIADLQAQNALMIAALVKGGLM